MRKAIQIPVVAESDPSDYLGRLKALAEPLQAMDSVDVRQAFGLTKADRLLKTTLSLCPACLRHVPAAVFERGDAVMLRQRCAEHGLALGVIENDRRYYHLSNKDQWGRRYAEERVFEIPDFSASGGCCGGSRSCAEPAAAAPWPFDFADQRSNKSCTVLVEVTDACNLACRVCYSDSKGDRILPLADFQRHLSALLAQKQGVDSVQITGGEASLHPQFFELLDWLYAQPVGKIYLPSNGIELGKAGFAERLVPYADKLLVLLQFDGTDAGANPVLRRAKPERNRLRLIQRLDRLGIAMQLTMTLSRGVSEDQIAWVVAQARRFANVRLLAMQPAFYSGRYELQIDPTDRITLSDVVKGIARGLGGKAREKDFLPIPCSHPNCGWVTLFARRFGLFANIARHVDLAQVMDQVAYKTLLSEEEMQSVVGTARDQGWRGWLARLARRLIRPRDVFGIAIKPFMDRYSYDQDRVSACCHHILDTHGQPVSFCEYNARLRAGDSWARFPQLPNHRVVTPAEG
ncbi:MAG: radical SAM protein [Xanthomonadales bacterium]|nr:radical SAM protein [Xanthomonadales bacterium]